MCIVYQNQNNCQLKKNEKFIYVNGKFDSTMVTYLKTELRSVTTGSKIIIRVNSYGGNIHAMNVMSALMYFMMKYKKCEVVVEIERAESAALMFAVNLPIRKVTKKSFGSIHLPVPRPNAYVTKSARENKINEAIRFFSRRTKLKKEEIPLYDGAELNYHQMLETGIATEMVEQFTHAA